MSKRICKCDRDTAQELAHYALEQFLVHARAEELIEKGQAMLFLSGILHRSYHSTTSPYHKLYREGGRVFPLFDKTSEALMDEDYDWETDLTIEAIQGVLEDMEADTIEMWFRAKLFRMWLDQPNYSELSRITLIPRTSISQAVQECKEYIKQRIDNYGINS